MSVEIHSLRLRDATSQDLSYVEIISDLLRFTKLSDH